MIDPKLHERVRSLTKEIAAISSVVAIPLEERVDMIKAVAKQILKEYQENEATSKVSVQP